MEAASTNPVTSFDFGSMSGVVSSSAKPERLDDDRPPADDTPTAATAVEKDAAPVKPEEDEDDLVVGDQLDSVGGGAVASSSASVSTPSNTSATQVSGDQETVAATEEAAQDNEVGTHGSDATLQNPMDPRMAALAAAGRQEMEQRQQERVANSGGRGGSGGLGIGAALGAGIAGTFKLVGNGLKAVHNPDLSKPKAMGIMERRANRDPNSAEQYYKGAGDAVLSEKIYRDAHRKIGDGMSAAATAELAFQDNVTRFNDLLQESPVAELAQKAQTSVGDYIHAVKSGTIKDAAAQAVVSTLQQDKNYLSAEKGVLDAANSFKQKSQEVTKALDSVDAAFPGRLDTNLRRQQISDLAAGMQNDEASKASSKIKQTMDELQKMAEAIKKAVMDVVHSIGSAFKPK